MPAREERRGHLFEVLADTGEGLVEAALDGLGELRAQVLQLFEARFEIGALRDDLGQAFLLALAPPRLPRRASGGRRRPRPRARRPHRRLASPRPPRRRAGAGQTPAPPRAWPRRRRGLGAASRTC